MHRGWIIYIKNDIIKETMERGLRPMNLNQLKYFDRLSYTLHYQHAAEQLGISQPALSRSISALEEELGAPLFDRTKRTVTLSECGQEFARHIRTAMREIETAEAAVREMADPQKQVIRLSSTFGLSATIIPPLVRDYTNRDMEKHIAFQLRQDSTPGILENLRSGVSELGFSSFMADQPDIAFEPVYRWQMCLVAPKTHKLARRKSVSLAEAAEHPMIFSVDKTYYMENLFRKHDLYPKVTMRLEEDHAIAAMVGNGFGLALLPYNDALRFYGVELVPVEEKDAQRTYYLTHLLTRPLSGQAKAFRQYVLEQDLQKYSQK